MPEDKQRIIYRIKKHLKEVGTPLVKIGEVIGSKAKTHTGKISTAKNFLAGKERSFDMMKVSVLEKFFGKSFTGQKYATDFEPAFAGQGDIPYGKASTMLKKVNKADDTEIEKIFADFVKDHPSLFDETRPSSLSPDAKRLTLRVYYSKK